jgi:hypothetical protein
MSIKPQVIETNADLLSANLFTFEIIGLPLTSPNFNRIEGMSRTVEPIEQADGGTGLMRKYHGGVIRYEDITIVRIRDGSANDKLLSDFITNYFATGIKADGAFIKRHHGEILRRIEFMGLCAGSEQLPSYDNATASPEEISYPMQVDYWEEIF